MKPMAYKPYWPNHKTDPLRCNETVYDRWRIDVIGHQCSRPQAIMVDGIGFCRVHAKRYQPQEVAR